MKSVVFGALALTSAVLADHAAAGHHWGARAAVEVEASASLTASATKHAAAASTVTAAPKIKAAASTAAGGSASALPLTQYTYSHDEIPYKVNPFFSTDPEYRGPQTGFNICNSTTAGADSECQTLVANDISDFCIWGPGGTAKGNILGDIEGATVAWCIDGEKYGARTIPPGAITGLQFMRTPAYIQWTGHINVEMLNFAADDTGGELDPHGADLLGNPVGGLAYSSGLPSGDNTTLVQATEWNQFYDGETFCLKICDPSKPEPFYCQNVYDLLGCAYNMPAAYEDKVFESCEGEVQDVVGLYTVAGGVTTSWAQPRDLDPSTTLPYTPRVPASSNCKTYQSTEILGVATATSTSSSAAPTKAGPTSAGAAASAASAGAGSGSASASAATASPSSGAGSPAVGSGIFALVVGVAAALV